MTNGSIVNHKDKEIECEFCIDIKKLSNFKEITQGGFGTLYKAKLSGYKDPVAVKVLNSLEDIDIECFIQEAAILNSLNHKYKKEKKTAAII